MKLFRKLAVNIHSRMEAVADQIENKATLSQSYIREYERLVAQAKVRQLQLEKEVERLEEEACQLETKASLWSRRAQQVYQEDEDKALECVRRLKKVQNRRNHVAAELESTRNLAHKMKGDVESMLQRLAQIKEKQRALVSRQVCADAVQNFRGADTNVDHDIDDLFARWEMDVVAKELHCQSATMVSESDFDSLERRFDQEDEEKELRQMLDELTNVPPQK